jgi:outer membrane protein TolC
LKLSASQLAAVQAERLPTVSAFGQLQAQGQRDDLRLGSYGWPRTSYLGAQVNVPIFSGFRTEARVQQTKLATRQEEIRLTYLKERIRNELDARLSSVRDAYTRTQVGKETVAATQVGYGQVAERYRLGLATRLELTDAELSLSQARINHLQALYDWQVAQVELQKATGQL